MPCYADRHTFNWGSSTATDAMPIALRCECGAMSREDIDPLRQLQVEREAHQAEIAALRAALEHIVQCADRGVEGWRLGVYAFDSLAARPAPSRR